MGEEQRKVCAKPGIPSQAWGGGACLCAAPTRSRRLLGRKSARLPSNCVCATTTRSKCCPAWWRPLQAKELLDSDEDEGEEEAEGKGVGAAEIEAALRKRMAGTLEAAVQVQEFARSFFIVLNLNSFFVLLDSFFNSLVS